MTANVPEYSVSEISGAIKRTVEDAFGYVRVRGELGRVSRSGNGHCYLDLKDERAVLSSVIWKGSWGRLSIKPEQGMEVIATGRLTTFAGQSRYQLVIDTLEPAGAGALMALLEARKKQLAAEGLFAAERKQPLPKMPAVVGVVTSPTGAVIRDILHRLRDRYPSHVLVWPTAVQGDAAPRQIVAGIEGFNRLSPDGPVPRPDVLIVARGGGSLEDLWGFNDEAVVRAAAASEIPLISAVGHETDTTLIDYAADVRAPTPTAAAEIAVPVRMDLLREIEARAARLSQVIARILERRQLASDSAARGLGRPDMLIGPAEQRFDRAADGLVRALSGRLDRAAHRFGTQGARLGPSLVEHRARLGSEKLVNLSGRLGRAPLATVEGAAAKLSAARLPRQALADRLKGAEERTARGTAALTRRMGEILDKAEHHLADRSRLLTSLSYRGVLERGFALVLDEAGEVVRKAGTQPDGAGVTLRFADGDRAARMGAKAAPAQGAKKGGTSAKPKGPQGKSNVPQGSLFDE